MTTAQHKAALWLEVAAVVIKSTSPLLSIREALRLFRGLDTIDARVAVLHGMHGMKLDQVAERLGCSKSRVHVRWVRARAELRKRPEIHRLFKG